MSCLIFDFFIALSDFHDKAHPSNDDQRPTIEDLLKKINPNKYKVVVEDLCSLSNAATTKKVNFYIASKGGILAGLGDFCRTNNIPFENVEYRYCRVATMGPVINNLSASPHLFLSTRSIELGVLVDEIEQTLNSLASIPIVT